MPSKYAVPQTVKVMLCTGATQAQAVMQARPVTPIQVDRPEYEVPVVVPATETGAWSFPAPVARTAPFPVAHTTLRRKKRRVRTELWGLLETFYAKDGKPEASYFAGIPLPFTVPDTSGPRHRPAREVAKVLLGLLLVFTVFTGDYFIATWAENTGQRIEQSGQGGDQ